MNRMNHHQHSATQHLYPASHGSGCSRRRSNYLPIEEGRETSYVHTIQRYSKGHRSQGVRHESNSKLEISNTWHVCRYIPTSRYKYCAFTSLPSLHSYFFFSSRSHLCHKGTIPGDSMGGEITHITQQKDPLYKYFKLRSYRLILMRLFGFT